MQTQIKICGLSNEAAIDAAAKGGATHIGLVHFEKSPRHVSLELAAALRMRTPPSLKVVLLLVNADPELTDKALQRVRPEVGSLAPSATQRFRLSIIPVVATGRWLPLRSL